MLFAFVWGITIGRHHFWLLPNLTEDCGFFESFVPLYTHSFVGVKSDEDCKTGSTNDKDNDGGNSEDKQEPRDTHEDNMDTKEQRNKDEDTEGLVM